MKHVRRTLALLVFAFAVMMIAKPVSAEAAAPKLNKSKVTIIVGKGKQLKVKNTSKKVKWSSSAKKIAKVDKTGYVTAKKEGSAVVTAKVGKKKLTCKVTVKEKPQLTKKEIICVGGKLKLEVTGTAKKVTWKSSKPKVVKVNKKGVITGKKLGKATITAKVGKKTLKCKVTVKKAVKAYQTSLAIENGGIIEVDYYSNAVFATSADPSIAKVQVVDYGMMADIQVYGVKTGTTTIAITNDCNKEVVNVKVTVNKPEAKGGQILVDWVIQNGEMTEDACLGVVETSEDLTSGYTIAYDPSMDMIAMGYVSGTDTYAEVCAIALDYRTNGGTITIMKGNMLTYEIDMLMASADFNTYEGQGFEFTDIMTMLLADSAKQTEANNLTSTTFQGLDKLLTEKANMSFADLGINGFVMG